MGIILEGNAKNCRFCTQCKADQKFVKKTSKVRITIVGQQMFINITAPQASEVNGFGC